MLPIHETTAEKQGLFLTERALMHIKKKLATQKEIKGIRLGTRKAGCSGLKYELDFVTTPNENDLCFPADENLSIFVSKEHYLFLKGSVIDYVKEGINTTLKVINPNEKGSCGCGESFTV